jgi:hypothetical protein
MNATTGAHNSSINIIPLAEALVVISHESSNGFLSFSISTANFHLDLK